MDDFPKETPRFWIAFSILCATLILAFVMAVATSTRVHAQAAPQQPICAPLSQLVPAWQEVHQERIVWEGVTPTQNGPVEVILFQSEKGTWSLFVVQGGIACLRAAGQNGTPVATDKGV